MLIPELPTQTFMSMGLFEWHPEEGQNVISPWWYVYFAVSIPLTIFVLGLYYVFHGERDERRKR